MAAPSEGCGSSGMYRSGFSLRKSDQGRTTGQCLHPHLEFQGPSRAAVMRCLCFIYRGIVVLIQTEYDVSGQAGCGCFLWNLKMHIVQVGLICC